MTEGREPDAARPSESGESGDAPGSAPSEGPAQPVDATEATGPLDAGESGEPTQPVDLGEATQPVELAAETGPFAPAEQAADAAPLVSPTAANRLLADVPPPATAPDATAPDATSPASGIDVLFGDGRFRDYDAAPVAPPAPRPPVPGPPIPGPPAVTPPPAGVRPPAGSRGAVAPSPRAAEAHTTPTQRVLLGVVGGLLAVAVLVGLFFLGTRLPMAATPTSPPTRSPSPTPTPVATVLPPGPVAAGRHRWDQLLGGECLAAFPGPWADHYTVVDCATPHPAQLVFRGWFPGPATSGYPGAAALQAQMSVLCSAPGVIDLAAASQYTDAQIEASYPATAAQWRAGDHWYYCFVSRSSKDPLTGSVAVAHAPTPTP